MLELYLPKPGDEKKFFDKHKVEKVKKLAGKATEDDAMFQATNVKPIDREKEHGYNADGSDEKVYESIEDKIEAAREKAKAAGKPIKKQQAARSMKRFVAGTAYGGSKQKDDKEDDNMKESVDLDEAHGAEDLYKMHYTRAKDLMKKLGGGLDTHKNNCMKSGCHYGHVGDVKNLANTLQDMHDGMYMQGEYAKQAVREQAEQVDEKKLTSAEMKKREEVASAIERDNPKMPMAKKMAIATSTAKKVAEQKMPKSLRQIVENMVTVHVKPHPTMKGHHVVVKSSDSSRFEPGEAIRSTELEQGQDDGYLKVKHVKG